MGFCTSDLKICTSDLKMLWEGEVAKSLVVNATKVRT
jgi:hypothetical protein